MNCTQTRERNTESMLNIQQTGGQEDRRAEGQKDRWRGGGGRMYENLLPKKVVVAGLAADGHLRRTEGQKGRRAEGQKGREDRRTGGQEDRRTGGQEDRRAEGQKDRRTEGQNGREDRWRRGGGGMCENLLLKKVVAARWRRDE
ncbi:hypothetical protein F4604DRAFT_1686220 [Suillus subluteus]|nr:hypothetical protein F4604DRAFT_1686220 [Suillus subluteus]